jgi:hypothetical protein
MEIWKTVVGNPNYEVSSEGRVRRCVGTHGTRAGRISKQRLDRRGYPIVGLTRYGAKTGDRGYASPYFVHRLVAEAFLPKTEGMTDVNHKNFDTTDNRVENLEWCTHAYNMAYSRAAGRWPKRDQQGAKNGNARLTEDDGRTIRTLRAQGARRKDLAARYGISEMQVYDIVLRKRWAHVD